MRRLGSAVAVALLAAFAGDALARRRRFRSLRDGVVVVTGGGRGLGLQIAREAALRGARLALVSRSTIELDAARDELRRAGADVRIFTADLRSDTETAATFERIAETLGPVDALFNVAGVIEVGPVDALTIDDYKDAIDTNFLAAVRCVEAVRPSMQARGAGRIVNVASLGGRISIPHLLPYSASKFAILGYSEGLHAELARYGVRVTTIVPGLMRTGSAPQATFAGQPKKEYAMFAPSDALPFTSVSAQQAAREIVDACERGDAEAIVSLQAQLAILAYRIAPRFVVRLLATGTRLLPDAGGGTEHRPGRASESPLTRSFVDELGHRATRDQHEDLDTRTSR